MAKGGGSTRTVSANNASAIRTTSTRNHRTGPGFTEPIKGPLANNRVKDGKEAHV